MVVCSWNDVCALMFWGKVMSEVAVLGVLGNCCSGLSLSSSRYLVLDIRIKFALMYTCLP
jgi:hypothetical protein